MALASIPCDQGRLIKGLAAFMWAVMAAACSTPYDARDDRQLQSHAHALDRPTHRPVRSLSSFSDSLACMDRMFRDIEMPTILITSKTIPDQSTRVPVATKEMIVTAISQMSRLSNAFRYVDFEIDISRQDTVQNLTTLLLNNNQIQLQRPALYVSGAVAFVDQNVINNRFEAGTSAERFETGYSKNKNATIVGLDLHLGDFRTRTFIPGLDSANEVIIGAGGQGLDLAGRIGQYGWNFNVGRDYAQGSGAAVRTLVDLAMIELVGKWARVPYWQCLTLDQTHPDLQRQLRDWYNEGKSAVHQSLVKKALLNGGYLRPDQVSLAMQHAVVREALGRFQADRGTVVTGVLDFNTYERALRNYVTLGADGSLQRVGWSAHSDSLEVSDAMLDTSSDRGEAMLPSPAKPDLVVDLQVENPVPNRTRFEQGTQIFLSVRVSRAAHLYCYVQDSKGRLMRLLPNQTNPASLVSANQVVRVPDWMVPNPGFVLDAGLPGEEIVMCLATAEDVMPALPASLQVPALTPILGLSGMDSVSAAFTTAAKTTELASQRAAWTVLPRRAAEPR